MNPLLEARQKLSRLLNEEEQILKSILQAGAENSAQSRRLGEIDIEKKYINQRLEELEGRRGLPPSLSTDNSEVVTVKSKKRTARGIFGDVIQADSFGFRGLAEMVNVIISGRSDERLFRASGASKIYGADGGFLVGGELVLQLFSQAIENSLVLQHADIVPVNGGSKEVVLFDESDHSGGSLYGFTSSWVAEGSEMTLRKPKVRSYLMIPKKLAILSAMTNELITDAPGSDNGMVEALGRALAFSLDQKLLIGGNGSGQVLSVLNSPSKITVEKESGQASGTIVYKNLSKMMSKLLPAFSNNAVWIASPSTRPQLLETFVTTEVDSEPFASHVPVLSQAQNGQEFLLGKPVYWSEHSLNVGSEGDIMLADLSAYTVGVSKQITIDRSDSAFFTSDEIGFRVITRVDAIAKLGTKVVSSNGTQLSWCVTLEDR